MRGNISDERLRCIERDARSALSKGRSYTDVQEVLDLAIALRETREAMRAAAEPEAKDWDPFGPEDQIPEDIRRDTVTEKGWAAEPEAKCKTCNGTGFVAPTAPPPALIKPCKTCNGNGIVSRGPEHEPDDCPTCGGAP